MLEDWMMAKIARKRELADQSKAIEAAGDDPESEAKVADLKRQMTAIGEFEKRLGEKRAEHRRFAKSTGNTGKIDALLTEGGIALAHDLDSLDAAEMDINTESGVLRFSVSGGPDQGFSRTADVHLLPHDRAQLMTKMMPVVYDPAATCPRFDAFFAQMQPDPEMRAFILRWLGLSMTAKPVQLLSFWYGSGNNGKSLLADLVARMLDGYAATAKIKSLTGVDRRGGGDATPDLMLLIGARFVRASEPSEGEQLQEALIKELTGGEPIMVRALHSDFVEFRPQFKLTISSNHKPMVRGTDDGIWRRLLLVPWDVQIPKDQVDEGLGNYLFEHERSGILNRLCDGLLDYLEGGLAVPQKVSDATKEFREESDPVGTFLE
ncbi:MAG: phage/plasmid primase, P4 family, partial [Pseudomonadota bacterium]